ncbi:MAG: AMP-binding protein, partial [Bacteroidaceae bacterium]|nr:AMP-binding protein [Bacteroidales bacterium]MCF0185563.1 AMP-binding protein [Bacteroidaceae bacterium]
MKDYTKKNFIESFYSATIENWDNKALFEFGKEGWTYGGLAREISVLHRVWAKAGLKKGEMVAVNARSSSNWASTFMASVTGGYVSVQLFNGFTPSDIQSLTNHSESRILYTEKDIFGNMDFDSMPNLIAAIDIHSQTVLASRNGFAELYEARYDDFDRAYPTFSKEDFKPVISGMDDICAIMYTSGSTGNPKGVMLQVRNFSANVELVKMAFPMYPGENHLTVLPFAHIFGLTVDMLTPLCIGMSLCVLALPPIPRTLSEAFTSLHPRAFFAVPLILSKFAEYSLGSVINTEEGREKLENYKDYPEFC